MTETAPTLPVPTVGSNVGPPGAGGSPWPFPQMSMPELLAAWQAAGYPNEMLLHPVDFIGFIQTAARQGRMGFGVSGGIITVMSDNTGQYFYLAHTKVRPKSPTGTASVDLSHRPGVK